MPDYDFHESRVHYPYRVWLDIELQKIAYDREDWKNNCLYPSDDETPKSE